MIKSLLTFAATAALLVPCAATAQNNPKSTETVTIGGKAVSVKYSSPSVRGRDVFGPAGPIAKDPTFPVWRAGADSATSFHTDADLTIGSLSVPKGDYTLFVNLKDPNNWDLIVNKQTGQWGLTYDAGQDLGRVKMTMSRPAAPVELVKYKLTDKGGNKGQLQLSWDSHAGSVDFTVK